MIRRLALATGSIALAAAVVFAAAPAYANPIPDDGAGNSIPGVGVAKSVIGAVTNDCPPKDAPDITAPDDGMAGFWMTPPATPDGGAFDPEKLWSQSGVSGFDQTTYDLGCATDPGNWADMVAAKTKTGTVNGIIGWSLSATALGDTLEQAAFNPSWIITALGDFADRATSIIQVRILVPFLGLGLLAALIALIWRGRAGNPSATLWGSAWAAVVLVATSVLLASPLSPSLTAERGAEAISATLHGQDGINPAEATTNRVMYAVHYQSWLRREFGSDDSPAAKKYGPTLFEATRYTWAEEKQAQSSVAARKKINEAKAKSWATTAAKVKAEDPLAYERLQGRWGNTGSAVLELLYGGAANLFRIFVALMMILAVSQLFALVMVWLVAAGYLVTPAGESLGRGLANTAWTTLTYLLSAVVGSWLWTIWTEVALAPGTGSWQSLVLLLIGLCVFWSALRPDRKILSVVSLGKVRGYGKTASRLTGKILDYAINFDASRRGSREGIQAGEETSKPAARSEDNAAPALPAAPAPQPRTVHEGVIHDPTPAPSPSGGVAPYDPVVIYQRPTSNHPVPQPPAADATPASTDIDIYGRSAS